MYKVRIIPRLDIKGPNLVKGIHLEGLRVLGNPGNFCEEFYQDGADEIFYMDCVASLFGRNSLNEFISQTAKKTFIPLTVGGGIRKMEDIRAVLQTGADKISINTAAIKDREFVRRASNVFGASTIVVSIEAIRQENGQYLAFIDNGREYTGLDVLDWAQEVEFMGAGEIVITSVDKEGTGEGFDIELIKGVKNRVKIPVIAHGGASSPENVIKMVKETGVNGVCIASCFHYNLLNSGKINRDFLTQNEGNTRFLNSGISFNKIKPFSIKELKEKMKSEGIPCR